MLNTVAALLWATGAPAQSADTSSARPDSLAAAATVGRVASPADTSSMPSVPAGPRLALSRVAGPSSWLDTLARKTTGDGTTAQRRRAVEYSDWYYRRLTIHKLASYTTLPLFATEYWLGQKLFDRNGEDDSYRGAHSAVATGIGVLFGVNTVTGVWNLWDSRHDTPGRARRITHSVLMLASDAGFVATAALAPDDDEGEAEGGSSGRDRHRAVAISSMGVSLASYLMMYLWKE